MIIAILLFRHIIKLRSNISVYTSIIYSPLLRMLTLCYLLFLYATYP